MADETEGGIYDALERSINLHHKQIDTLRELVRSLRVADLLDIPHRELKNHQISWRVEHGRSVFFGWKGGRLIVTVKLKGHPVAQEAAKRMGFEETRSFDLKEVPEELWPADLLKSFKSFQRMQKKKAQGLF